MKAAAGDNAGALYDFQVAGRLAPAWPHDHLMIGQMLAREGKMDAAKAEWRKALSTWLPAQDMQVATQELTAHSH